MLINATLLGWRKERKYFMGAIKGFFCKHENELAFKTFWWFHMQVKQRSVEQLGAGGVEKTYLTARLQEDVHVWGKMQTNEHK